MAQSELKEWYYADGLIMPKGTKTADGVHGVNAPSNDWLVVFNPAGKPITVELTYYFEDSEPRVGTLSVPARAPIAAHMNTMPDLVPHKKLYGARIRSLSPIIVQATRAECEEKPAAGHHGNSTSSFVAYPGPLGIKETKWIYPDCYVALTGAWIDVEWITILNPNPGKEADIKITFNAVEGQKVHRLKVPAERVRTVELAKLPEGEFFRSKICTPLVESDVPVIVEQLRRVVIVADPTPRGMWATLALPIGDRDLGL